MTIKSNAAKHERDQLGTYTSAGRVLSFVEASPQPLSSSGACEALWQKSVKQSQSRQLHDHLNDISRHGVHECPGGGEQCGQASTSVKRRNNHIINAWTSLDSRTNPKFGGGCALSHACDWGAEMASSLALSTVDAPTRKCRKPALRIVCADDGKGTPSTES